MKLFTRDPVPAKGPVPHDHEWRYYGEGPGQRAHLRCWFEGCGLQREFMHKDSWLLTAYRRPDGSYPILYEHGDSPPGEDIYIIDAEGNFRYQ